MIEGTPEASLQMASLSSDRSAQDHSRAKLDEVVQLPVARRAVALRAVQTQQVPLLYRQRIGTGAILAAIVAAVTAAIIGIVVSMR
jgi:hypothetical protein